MRRRQRVHHRLMGIAAAGAALVPTLVMGTASAVPQGPTVLDAAQWQTGTIAGEVVRTSHPADPIGFTLQEDRVFADTPADRYALSRGCYALTDAEGSELIGQLRMQATDLGTYLFFDTNEEHVTADGAGVGRSATPGASGEWLVDEVDGGFTVQHPATDQVLLDDLSLVDAPSSISNESTGMGEAAVGPSAASIAGIDGALLSFAKDDGCAVFPEPEINVTGAQPTGTTAHEEVEGYVDAHVHWMAFEFIGGSIRCGRPWHRYGVTVALVDCPDHAGGTGGGEIFVTGPDSIGHDTVGWPTFVDWPASDSLTHEAMYHAWVERAWRGGLRLMVNLLVDNRVLCEVYPITRNPCDEENTLELEYEALREMERYIDAQYGGPGKGWLRVITDGPFEARAVMNSGRMAVIPGIETSELFNCRLLAAPVSCTEEHVTASLDKWAAMGVSQMELLNKYDNAFTGVTGDGGTTGATVNNGNVASAGSYWDMQTCPEEFDEHQHDKTQPNLSDVDPGFRPLQDALFGDLAGSFIGGAAPLYPGPPHCNTVGLTDLGEFLLDEMMERGMLIDPDHMSTRGRQALLAHTDAAGYHGMISSHSWSDQTVYEKVLEMGGVVTPYAGGSEGFVNKWRQHLDWVDPRYEFGFGYGADTNGFGGQGGPRGAGVDNPVVYPHTGFGGVTVDKQVSGARVYDLNVDGVDHYGLYADWFEDLRMIGGEEIMADMRRGPEAYLQTWERALGATVDRCREDTGAPNDPSVLQVGMSSEETVFAFGQPTSRIGDVHTWCVPLSDGTQGTVVGTFDAEGHLIGVSGTDPTPAPDPDPTESPVVDDDHDHEEEQLPATGWDLPFWGPMLLGSALFGYGALRRREA